MQLDHEVLAAAKRLEKNRYFRQKTKDKDILSIPPSVLHVEMGTCNLNCGTCYGNYGRKTQKQDPKNLEIIMDQIDDTAIGKVSLSDGEPFHDFPLLLEMVEVLRGFPTDIFTNATFATSTSKAVDHLTQLREAGYSFGQRLSPVGKIMNSLMATSVDDYHGPGSFDRALNLMEAYFEVFGDTIDSDNLYLAPSIVWTDHKDKNRANIDDLHHRFGEGFTKISNDVQSFVVPEMPRVIHYKLDKGIVSLQVKSIAPIGNARNLRHSREPYEFRRHSIKQQVDPFNSILMSSNGNLYYGNGFCKEDGKCFGNVKSGPLAEQIKRMRDDPIYQLALTKGINGIIQTAYEHGFDYEIKDTDRCQVCHDIFSDLGLLNQIRGKLRN